MIACKMQNIMTKESIQLKGAACFGAPLSMLETSENAKEICLSCSAFDACRTANDINEYGLEYAYLADMVFAGETRRERLKRRASSSSKEAILLKYYLIEGEVRTLSCVYCSRAFSSLRDKKSKNGLCHYCYLLAEAVYESKLKESIAANKTVKKTEKQIIDFYKSSFCQERANCFGCGALFKNKSFSAKKNKKAVANIARGLCNKCLSVTDKNKATKTREIEKDLSIKKLTAKEIYEQFDEHAGESVLGTYCFGCGNKMRASNSLAKDFPKTVKGRSNRLCDYCFFRRRKYMMGADN